MTERIMYIPQQPVVPIGEHRSVSARKKGITAGEKQSSVSFKNLLDKEITTQKTVKFSAHAQQRLRTRNIKFDQQQIDRITDAVDRAAEKGSRDSLLLVDNIAAVVSVENRTVITVAQGDSLKDNVFTNIDSAVIA